jgi:hypothetical protein
MSKTLLGLSESQRAWVMSVRVARREYSAGYTNRSWLILLVGAVRMHGDWT